MKITQKKTSPLRRFSPNAERSTPNGSFNESGFTLLELIMVMILSLMLLGLVVVYFSHLLASVKLQTTVRDLSTTLRQARYLSKINGEQQGVTIDLDSKTFGLDGRTAKKIPSNLDFSLTDSNQTEIRSGQYHIVFEPNWIMESVTFQLSNKKKTMWVRLDPLLGATVSK